MSTLDPIHYTGAELWAAFSRLAGLEPDTPYDRDLRDAVGRRLRLGWGSDIVEEIDRAGVDATSVLIAVFDELEPWAEMMRDLLDLLSASGVTQTRTRLRADVDIDRASAELDLNLSSFEEALRTFEEVRQGATRLRWGDAELGQLWALARSFEAPEDAELPPDVVTWLEAYEPEITNPVPDVPWPQPTDEPPITGLEDLDCALEAAWTAWKWVLDGYRELSSGRLDLYTRVRPSMAADLSAPSTESWLVAVDHDRFAGTVLRGLHGLARRVGEGIWEDEHGRFDNDSPPGRLVALVDGLEPEIFDEATIDKRLQRLLSLPVWKHRYDVYSNWVFTQIVAALRQRVPLAVDHEDGRIDFGFAQAKLAGSSEHDLAVFCEMRSDLVGTSVKRTSGVQPDYTVVLGDKDAPYTTSLLEVECKQYRQASRSNFAAALQDYARSRINARVLLVNYGRVSARICGKVLGDVDEAVRDRCEIVGDLRPRQAEPQRLFAAKMVSALDDRLPAAHIFSAPLRIELAWKDTGVQTDLDLYLEVAMDSHETICFQNPNSAREYPFATLEHDVRRAPGPEVLTIDTWLPVVYRVAVQRYDGDALDACRPTLSLVGNQGMQLEYQCPVGVGDRWDVVEIDGRTGAVTLLDLPHPSADI